MIIGLTGGIGCGKSTFRDILNKIAPLPHFDADKEAKDLLITDPEVRRTVITLFGDNAYTADGYPNRGFLREAIFCDPVLRKSLERVVHPKVRELWQQRSERTRAANEHLLLDIPLLFETGGESHCDTVIVVACSDEIQRERLAARGLPASIASGILASQMPQSHKIALADFVIWNDGPLRLLREQAERLGGILF